MAIGITLASGTAHAQSAPAGVEMTAPGPSGALAGTLIDPDPKAPLVVIIPGSGPTDRDGNNPMGIKGASYRLLAEALAARGVATLRVDKRGMFGSRAAIANPDEVTIADYASDAHAWADAVHARTGRKCVWLLGHSEGGLVALQAAQDGRRLCGVILVAAAGRPLGEVMRQQFQANPANAPILEAAMGMIDAVEAGKRYDAAALPPPLNMMFPEAVEAYLIDIVSYDPARLAAKIRFPLLIVQGERDMQVSVTDAELLSKAAPGATLTLLPGVNHVLKAVASDDRAANIATYGDPSLPIAPGVVDAIAGFVTAKR